MDNRTLVIPISGNNPEEMENMAREIARDFLGPDWSMNVHPWIARPVEFIRSEGETAFLKATSWEGDIKITATRQKRG